MLLLTSNYYEYYYYYCCYCFNWWCNPSGIHEILKKINPSRKIPAITITTTATSSTTTSTYTTAATARPSVLPAPSAPTAHLRTAAPRSASSPPSGEYLSFFSSFQNRGGSARRTCALGFSPRPVKCAGTRMAEEIRALGREK
ncbi:hypothetical protein NL108_012314 [Boleophthalmus pectinirostris]|nr:hypothetical protein NL108_012314 [Boleophthalmus pectinirostris]